MQRYTADFESALADFDFATLERDAHSVFALAPDLTIAYVNPSWGRFAAENAGEPAISERFGLGVHIGSAIQGPLRRYYLDAYERIMHTGFAWHRDYECSSADTYRRYHQTVYPLRGGRGLLAVNSLAVSQPMDKERVPQPAVAGRYTSAQGFIVQCSHCRRVERADASGIWDWVPEWVQRVPDNLSHGLCRPCFEYYFKFRTPQRG